MNNNFVPPLGVKPHNFTSKERICELIRGLSEFNNAYTQSGGINYDINILLTMKNYALEILHMCDLELNLNKFNYLVPVSLSSSFMSNYKPSVSNVKETEMIDPDKILIPILIDHIEKKINKNLIGESIYDIFDDEFTGILEYYINNDDTIDASDPQDMELLSPRLLFNRLMKICGLDDKYYMMNISNNFIIRRRADGQQKTDSLLNAIPEEDIKRFDNIVSKYANMKLSKSENIQMKNELYDLVIKIVNQDGYFNVPHTNIYNKGKVISVAVFNYCAKRCGLRYRMHKPSKTKFLIFTLEDE